MNRIEYFDREISKQMDDATSDKKYLKCTVTVTINSRAHEIDMYKVPSEPLMYVDAVSIIKILGYLCSRWKFRGQNIVAKVDIDGRTVGLITKSQALKALKSRMSEDEAVEIRKKFSGIQRLMDMEMYRRLLNCMLDPFNETYMKDGKVNSGMAEEMQAFLEEYKLYLEQIEPGLYERKWTEYKDLVALYSPRSDEEFDLYFPNSIMGNA